MFLYTIFYLVIGDFPLQGISLYKEFPCIRDFPLQWIPLYKGFPFIRDCPLEGIYFYKGFSFRRDFPLQGNSFYKGFPFTKDCVYDSPTGPLRSPPCWLAHHSAQAQGSRESEPIHQMKAQRSAAQRRTAERGLFLVCRGNSRLLGLGLWTCTLWAVRLGAEKTRICQRLAGCRVEPAEPNNKNTWETQK